MTNQTILFISRAYGKNSGGMERLSFDLINEFKKDPSLTIKTLTHEPPPNADLNTVRRTGALKAITIIPQALKEARNADVVHLGDPLLSLAGWLIKTVYKKPIFVTVHGLDVSYNNRLYQLYLKLFFRHFDGYIAISEHAKKLLEKWHPTGHITVIPPGIRDYHFQPETSRKALEQLAGQEVSERVVLTTVGRLVPRKGHAWFIEHVFSQLPTNYMYLIVGTGPEEDSIRHLITKLNLENRVRLLGRLPEKDLTIIYNTVDAFIQPNIPTEGDAEGFGLVLLEAALCERLVLASNLEGIPQAIHNKRNGQLLDPKNAENWRKAIHEQVKPETKNPGARRYTLNHFSWAVIKTQYETLFQV